MSNDRVHVLSAHSFVLGEGEPLRLGSSGSIAGECTRFLVNGWRATLVTPTPVSVGAVVRSFTEGKISRGSRTIILRASSGSTTGEPKPVRITGSATSMSRTPGGSR